MTMTIALAVQTDVSRIFLSITFPTYKPSSLLLVIGALFLAIFGLAVDALLFPAAVMGTFALWPVAVAAGLVIGLLILEIRNRV
jgi:hypothetical protein